MFHAHLDRRIRRPLKVGLLVSAVATALMLPAPPAQASCTPNATGIAQSNGTAGIAATQACPPAYGQPAGGGTGRKVG